MRIPSPTFRAILAATALLASAPLVAGPPEAGRRSQAALAFGRGYELHHERDYEGAIAAWEEALRLGSEPGGTSYNIACGHARLGRTDQALAWLERAADEGFDLEDYLTADSDLASLRGDARFQALVAAHGGARKAELLERRLEKALEASEPDGDRLYDVGMDLHRAGDYAGARRAFEAAIRADHNAAAATYNIACGHALAGEKDEAFARLEQAIELGYGDGESFDRDEDLDSLRGDPRYAELARRADQLELPPLGEHLGSRRVTTAMWKAALAEYEEYLAQHPSSGRAWFNIGFATLRLDDPRRAAEAFRKAFDLGHRPAASAYNVACAQALLGERDQAFAWIERARARGFDDLRFLARDPDLRSLRDDPRFRALAGAGGATHDEH